MNVKGFIGPAYRSISEAINAQRCINLRLEIDAANGKAPLALIGLPGYEAIKEDFPAAEVRGTWEAKSRKFVVVGNKLYELHSDLTHTERGELVTSAGVVSIADNGIHMLIVDGVSVLALTLADNTTTDSISNFPYGSKFVACVDNTFVALDPNSQRFQISAVGDGLTWSALDFASAEGDPDDLLSMVAFSRQLHMLGSKSVQVFWNSGDATRPFVPVEGSFSEVGIIAPCSAAKSETGVYFLGAKSRGGLGVYKIANGQTSKVSEPSIETEFAGRDGQPGYTLEDAEGCTFGADGHSYYVLTFPTTNKTWIYDETTGGWSEFLEWDGAWSRTRLRCFLYAFGMLIAGDITNGKLYRVASDIYTNNGRTQRALRASAYVSQDERVLSVGSFEVVCQRGVGLTSGQGSNPKMMLRVSKNGVTYGPEMTRSMGNLGDYQSRARWPSPCGIARSYVFEVSITDPVKRAIVKAVVNGN